ncbi:MAG: hypothetical protein WD359_00120, partial [Dehalococcoidia bacterium]
MVKRAGLGWLVAPLLLAVACGPYRTEADATAQAAGDRIVSAFGCDDVVRFDDEGPIPPGAGTPTPHFPNGTPTALSVVDADNATSAAASTMTAEASASTAAPTSTPCADRDVRSVPTVTSTPPTPVLAITATSAPATETPIPTSTPQPIPLATGTSAVATAT